jgi:tRNA threonylcarbamoyladenosine biosynthesis protein TsaE
VNLETTSEEATEDVGERIGRVLPRGSVVGLIGPLGAGKTVLARGIARACGVDASEVTSPTFLTAAEYGGRVPVTHIDLYRHADVGPDPEWLAELIDRDGVAVIEWFEQLQGGEALDALVVEIQPGPDADRRTLSVAARGARARAALRALAHEVRAA